mmetsp:Transcript_9539/g.24270  ORF Transcript_9539/g.24270 Transcript_9539/m.24270 type:complete len:324 (-) Transcript_9539:253-1224(-)|eukprot:jgi/Tetstr1/431909/TSEL_021398.t1
MSGGQPEDVARIIRRGSRLLWVAPRGFAYAVANPRVLNNYRRLILPTVTATVVVRLLTFLLLLPVKIILLLLWLISLGALPGLDAVGDGLRGVSAEAVNLAPFLVMEVFRTVYSKSLTKCFFETLQAVNPDVGSQLPKLKPLPKTKAEAPDPNASFLRRLLLHMQANKALTIMLVSLSIRLWRSAPVVGVLAAPVSNFLLLWKRLPTPYALVVSGFCLAPPVAPLAFRAAELYRGGRVLSDLLITPYLLRVVPYAQREKFLRRHELALLAFGLPFYYIMGLPFLGPLAYIVAQAAAAALCDEIVQTEGFPVKTVTRLTVAHQL